MTISEIKYAVNIGKTVCWANASYQVIKDSIGQWLIVYMPSRDCVGLTNLAGDTLNGKESEFYILN